MFKLKKLLAGVLGAAMMMTSMTALADESTPSTTVSTIDTTRTGSLTIHKYYYENQKPDNLPAGTGEATTITGATPLKDAEFTAWRIADVEGNVVIPGKTEQDFTVAGVLATDVAAAEALVKSGDTYISETYKGTTDANGEITFSGISQDKFGIYYVKETATPTNVSSEPVDFVVSIPMTSQKTNKGEAWIYDVHVYPKNVVVKAGITLKKVGNSENAIDGSKFVLQIKNGDSWDYVSLTNSVYNYDDTEANSQFTVSADGMTFSDLKEGEYRFIEVAASDGYIMDGSKVYGFSIAANGNVTSTVENPTFAANNYTFAYAQKTGTTEGSTENDTKSGIITVNNEKPDLDKLVNDRAGNWDHDADYSAGDTVPYKVTVRVPENITELKTFKVTDSPKHLDDTLASIEIKYNGSAISNASYNTPTETSVKDTDEATEIGKGFEIAFIPAQMAAYAGKEIVITYNAVLHADAIITENGNPNTATLTYSNEIIPTYEEDSDNPNNPDAPNPTPGNDTISDEAVVYTFKLVVKKYKDSEADANLISGVEFNLYKYDYTGTGTPTEAEVKTGTPIGVTGADGTYTVGGNTTTLVTKEGIINVSGLENGTYYLVETKTIDGYNLLTKPVKVELNVAYSNNTTTSTTWTTDNDGNKHIVKTEVKEATFTNTDDTATNTVAEGYKTADIINKKGFTLPSTGGMGSIIFIVGGIALAMAGLLIILASNKKAAAK